MNDPQSPLMQASEAARKGDKATAQRLLDELVFNEPKNEQAWLLLAEVVEQEKEAADCLGQALAINPDNAAARQEYDELQNLHPLYTEAKEAMEEGDNAQAETMLDNLVSMQPKNARAWLLLSQVASGPEKVEKCLRQVLAIAPDNIEASRRLS